MKLLEWDVQVAGMHSSYAHLCVYIYMHAVYAHMCVSISTAQRPRPVPQPNRSSGSGVGCEAFGVG